MGVPDKYNMEIYSGIQTYVTNRLKVSKIARGQVIHRMHHTCGGLT